MSLLLRLDDCDWTTGRSRPAPKPPPETLKPTKKHGPERLRPANKPHKKRLSGNSKRMLPREKQFLERSAGINSQPSKKKERKSPRLFLLASLRKHFVLQNQALEYRKGDVAAQPVKRHHPQPADL